MQNAKVDSPQSANAQPREGEDDTTHRPPAVTPFLAAFGHLAHASDFADTAPKGANAHPDTKDPGQKGAVRRAPSSLSSVQQRPSAHQSRQPDDGQSAQHPQRHISAALAHARAKTIMLASARQRPNPMLQHVRHVRVEFDSTITPDFVCGSTTAVLYLSLQYHRMHGAYIYERIRELGSAYRLRVLLVLADVDDHRSALRELTRLALHARLTLVCVASEREAARYCETLRAYDEKTADSIRERVDNNYPAQLQAALTSVRGVNKTDVATLGFRFGAFKRIATATEEELRQCPGIGERKVSRLYAAMNQPFKTEVDWNGKDVGEDEVG